MINYDEILLNQKLIKARIAEQQDFLIWSFPYINLKDHKQQIEQEGFSWSNYVFKIDENKKNLKINGKILLDFSNNTLNLFNLPYHIGIDITDFITTESEIKYIINQNPELILDFTPKGVIYKNSKKQKDYTLQDYIIFSDFANQNYLTYFNQDEKGDKSIIFKFEPFFERGVLTTDDVFGNLGPYYIDRVSNPAYIYYGSLINNKIYFQNILNGSINLIQNKDREKGVINHPSYFTGMPLQEQLFYEETIGTKTKYNQVFGDVTRGKEQMYKLIWDEGKKIYVRDDYIEYNVPENLKLRLY